MPNLPVVRPDLEVLYTEDLPMHWIIRNRKSGNMWMKAGQDIAAYDGNFTLELQNETITKIVVGGMSNEEVLGYT